MKSIMHLMLFLWNFYTLGSTSWLFPADNSCTAFGGKFGNCKLISECDSKNLTIEDILNNECYGENIICCPIRKPIFYLREKNYYTSLNVVHKNVKLLPDECGKSEVPQMRNKRQVALKNEFPWMALLLSNSTDGKGLRFPCVGTIINERYVLTSANCLEKNIHSVRVGLYNIKSASNCKVNKGNGFGCSNFPQDFSVEKVVQFNKHSGYQPNNDIALIRLSQPLNIYSEYTRAICLPLQKSVPDRENINYILIGWGISQKGATNKLLMKKKVSLLSRDYCNEYYSQKNIEITEKQLCCDSKPNNKMAVCNDDIGGPLQHLDNDRYILQGIVSSSAKLCNLRRPTIYTKVDQYINWILDNIEP